MRNKCSGGLDTFSTERTELSHLGFGNAIKRITMPLGVRLCRLSPFGFQFHPGTPLLLLI